MAYVFADRVKETTATTGTGPLALGGAEKQFQPFVGAIGSGSQCYYCLLSADGIAWEVGSGTVTDGAPPTLTRDAVLASSNVGALINLTGVSTVFLTAPAAVMGPSNVMDALLVTTANTLPPLSKAPAHGKAQLIVNGRTFCPVGAAMPFSVVGNVITWLSPVFSVMPGDEVIAAYNH